MCEQTEQAKHTPVPWKVQSALSNPHLRIVGDRGLIASIAGSGPVVQKGFEANAAFIVRACNSHGALLEACKHANRVIAGLLRSRGQNQRIDANIAQLVIEAVIDKAEGRAHA